MTHREEIGLSYVTVLKLIDQRLIPGIRNIDLTKRVKYPASYKKRKGEPTNLAFLTNRTYDNFVNFISDNPSIDVVEMDTVLSCRDGESCLLTLLFKKSNYMIAFKLENKTNDEVIRVFNKIKESLGKNHLRKLFNAF